MGLQGLSGVPGCTVWEPRFLGPWPLLVTQEAGVGLSGPQTPGTHLGGGRRGQQR